MKDHMMDELWASLSPEQQKIIQDLMDTFDKRLKNYEFIEEVGGGVVAVKMKYPGTVTKIYITCEMKEENRAIIEDLIPLAIANALKSLYKYEDELILEMNDKLTKQLNALPGDLDIVKMYGDKDDKETLN